MDPGTMTLASKETDLEAVQRFNAELAALYDVRLPISKTKINNITKAAMTGIRMYKHIVQSVERFIHKCRPEFKLPALYVIDSIVRQSRHAKAAADPYGPRFTRNFLSTFENLLNHCLPEDKPKVVRVLNLWQKNTVFAPDIIQPLLDLAHPRDDGARRPPPSAAMFHSAAAAMAAFGRSNPNGELASQKQLIETIRQIMEGGGSLEGAEEDDFDSLDPDASTPTEAEPIYTFSRAAANAALNREEISADLNSKIGQFAHMFLGGPEQQQQATTNGPQASSGEVPGPNNFELPSGNSSTGNGNGTSSNSVLEQLNSVHNNNNSGSYSPPSPPVHGDTLFNLPNSQSSQSSSQVVPSKSSRGGDRSRDRDHRDRDYRDRDSHRDSTSHSSQKHSGEFSKSRSRGDRKSRSPSAKRSSWRSVGQPSSNSSSFLPPPPPPTSLGSSSSHYPRVEGRDRDYRRPRDRSGRSRSRSPAPRSPPRTPPPSKSGKSKADEQAELERDRRSKGLPGVYRPEHLVVASTTLWIGHVPKYASEADLSDFFGDYGEVKSINLIPSRGCAYICMVRRLDAHNAHVRLKKNNRLMGFTVKCAWAPGKALKERNYQNYWEMAEGVAMIPWSVLLTQEEPVNLAVLEDGGVLEDETVPPQLREALKKLRTLKVEAEDDDMELEPPLSSAVSVTPTAAYQQPPIPPPSLLPPAVPPGFPPGPFLPGMTPGHQAPFGGHFGGLPPPPHPLMMGHPQQHPLQHPHMPPPQWNGTGGDHHGGPPPPPHMMGFQPNPQIPLRGLLPLPPPNGQQPPPFFGRGPPLPPPPPPPPQMSNNSSSSDGDVKIKNGGEEGESMLDEEMMMRGRRGGNHNKNNSHFGGFNRRGGPRDGNMGPMGLQGHPHQGQGPHNPHFEQGPPFHQRGEPPFHHPPGSFEDPFAPSAFESRFGHLGGGPHHGPGGPHGPPHEMMGHLDGGGPPPFDMMPPHGRFDPQMHFNARPPPPNMHHHPGQHHPQHPHHHQQGQHEGGQFMRPPHGLRMMNDGNQHSQRPPMFNNWQGPPDGGQQLPPPPPPSSQGPPRGRRGDNQNNNNSNNNFQPPPRSMPNHELNNAARGNVQFSMRGGGGSNSRVSRWGQPKTNFMDEDEDVPPRKRPFEVLQQTPPDSTVSNNGLEEFDGDHPRSEGMEDGQGGDENNETDNDLDQRANPEDNKDHHHHQNHQQPHQLLSVKIEEPRSSDNQVQSFNEAQRPSEVKLEEVFEEEDFHFVERRSSAEDNELPTDSNHENAA